MQEKKVDIVLSIYNPNIDFLKKQLISLNNQDYKNIELYIYDDCIDNKCDICIFSQYITNFPYNIIPSEKENLGYVKAFEKLVSKTDGDYIAFCDQDDIWFKNKISKSVEILNKERTLLVASEKQIIDENDIVVKELSRENSNKNYDNWHSYDDIFKYTSIYCFAVGMCIVARGDFLRSIIPFPLETGHDKWALICASAEGNVSFIEEPLVQYRRHGKNVTSTLAGVSTRQDYLNERTIPNYELALYIQKKYPNHKDINEVLSFAKARKEHNTFDLIKYRYLAPDIAKFEIVLSIIPDFLFPLFVKFVKFLSK